MPEAFKKQHIVPQAYLKHFATQSGGKYLIGTKVKPTSTRRTNTFLASVSNIAYIENYYDTVHQKDPKHWEHYFADNFDTLCGQYLGNLISKITLSQPGNVVLTSKDKALLSQIIMSQTMRVPAFLEEQTKHSEEVLTHVKKEFIHNLPDNCLDLLPTIQSFDLAESEHRNLILDVSFNPQRFSKFCDLLARDIWVVYFNVKRSELPFITSDNPVMFSEYGGSKSSLTQIGLTNTRLVVNFPISPSILISVYSRSLFWGALRKYDGTKKVIDDTKFVIAINNRLEKQCRIHSFLPEPLFEQNKGGISG